MPVAVDMFWPVTLILCGDIAAVFVVSSGSCVRFAGVLMYALTCFRLQSPPVYSDDGGGICFSTL